MKSRLVMVFTAVLFFVTGAVAPQVDVKDIKPPVSFISDYFFVLLFVAILILVFLIFFLSRFLKDKLNKRTVLSSLPSKPAHQIAYEALAALKAKNLPGQGKIKEYYFELSDIVRRYIENRFAIRAPEMTTEEFLISLGNYGVLATPHKNLVKKFLELCDIVKFARYGPTMKEIDKSFETAEQLIDETRSFEEEYKKASLK